MRAWLWLMLVLFSACQTKPPALSKTVYLAKDIIYPISSVESSKLDTQFIHRVTYQSKDKQRFDYLVQLDISAKQDYMALVATSLLGIPLITFEMRGAEIKEVNRVSDKLPSAKRLVADLQLMLWPLEQLNSKHNLLIKESCAAQCVRKVFIEEQPIAKIIYQQNLTIGDIRFENLVHQYQMTIKSL